MAELNDINKSGELTDIKLGGTADTDKVLKAESLGNYTFSGETMLLNGFQTITDEAGTLTFNIDAEFTVIDIYGLSVTLGGLQTSAIDSADGKSAVTKEWVESKITGATGSFTTSDGKTVTVENGLITSIV